MCGISLIFSPHAAALAAPLRQMTSMIRHRGPDDEGYLLRTGNMSPTVYYGDDTPAAAISAALPWQPKQHVADANHTANLAMGHRRLAIVEPSPLGHQPMSYANGRYWITYNGEVFNHVELRQELEVLGHTFVSHSDTEVILAAYAEWGPRCLERFNGMWAFAILDTSSDTVFLARDRFGVKPLYYNKTNAGTLAFASEIKQLTALPGWKARANIQRTHDFLVWNVMDHTDETLFDAVYQIPAGHYTVIDAGQPLAKLKSDGRLETTAWYELKPGSYTGSYEDAAAEFKHLLQDSIRLRLRADVPVGSCLSGGLDSSSIVCLMHGQLQGSTDSEQSAFSACSDVASVDERAWIDMVVQQTGVTSHKTIPDLDQLFEALPDMTWHQDEPFSSTSIFAQWSVYRLVSGSDVRVILNGQGADEILAGYHVFLAPRLTGLLCRGNFPELIREMRAMKRELGYSPMYALQRMADMLLPPAIRQSLRHMVGRPSSMNNNWLAPSYLNEIATQGSVGAVEQTSSVQALSLSLLKARHLPMLLHWEDRNSMAHSIESRVPFLDYRLVEFCLSLPDDFKLKQGLTKRVMRTAMDGVLPEAIRQRRDKIGFATPESVWMKEKAPEQFRIALKKAIEQSAGILTPNALDYLNEVLAGKQAFSFLPWRMISLGAWVERFNVETA